MRYDQYIMKNNVFAEIYAPISSLATTIQVKAGQGARFGNNFPQLLTIENFGDNGEVLKREIVKLTGVSGDYLTVVRGFAPCPPSDSANGQSQTTFSFSADDKISLYIPKEIFDRIADAIVDLYDNGNDRVFVYSTGGLGIGITGGNVRVGNDIFAYQGGTFTLQDNSANFVMIDGSGTIRNSTTDWDNKYTRLAFIQTSSGEITNIVQQKLDAIGGEFATVGMALGVPTNLSGTTDDLGNIIVKWKDPDDLPVFPEVKRVHSLLVAKEGSAPENPTDGIVVTTEETRNQYETNGFVASGLNVGNTYLRVFALSNSGFYSYGDSIKPTWKTFTVKYHETSTPTSFSPVYSDDATGLTPGSSTFDTFFGMEPVLLSSAGVETATLKKNNFAQDINGNAVNITSGDNVMIKFPIRGLKISRSGEYVTISITNGPNRESEGFQYYAFSRNKISNPDKRSAFYLGAYLGYDNNGTLKSWSGKTPTGTLTQENFITRARANDGNNGYEGYDICGYYQREYIKALYMMKYGNPNSQSIVGNGYIPTSGTTPTTTGGLNSSGMTYGTTSNYSTHCKLFGLEDMRGNMAEWIGGFFYGTGSSNKDVYVALSGFNGKAQVGTYYEVAISNVPDMSANQIMTKIYGTNEGMFLAQTKASGSSTPYFYCDVAINYPGNLMYAGLAGYNSSGQRYSGLFYEYIYPMYQMESLTGARLMYLK